MVRVTSSGVVRAAGLVAQAGAFGLDRGGAVRAVADDPAGEVAMKNFSAWARRSGGKSSPTSMASMAAPIRAMLPHSARATRRACGRTRTAGIEGHGVVRAGGHVEDRAVHHDFAQVTPEHFIMTGWNRRLRGGLEQCAHRRAAQPSRAREIAPSVGTTYPSQPPRAHRSPRSKFSRTRT